MLIWNRGQVMAPIDGQPAGGGGAPAGAAPAAENAPLAGGEGEPGTGGVPVPVTAGTPPAVPADAPVVPDAAAPQPVDASISMTSQQLTDRMARDRQAYLRGLGFETEGELVAMQAAQREQAEATETARREQQTREETLQEDLTARTTERDAAIAEGEQLRWERHCSGICATVGVRNVEYAMFELERAANALGDSEELDVEAWLQERIDPANAGQHGTMAAALGMAAPPVQVRDVPITTTGDRPPPVAPPAGGGPPSDGDAMGMDPAAWAAHKESLGIG